MTKPISFSNFSEADTHKTQDGKTAKKGLWYNINQRKKKGLSPKKPGSKGYPKTLDIESYGDSITTPKMRALAKADAQPKKPVTLPKAPWEKGTNVTYDKNGRVVKEAKTRHTAKSIGHTINKVAMHGVDDLVKKIDGMEPQGEYGKKMRARRARSDRDIAQAKKEAAVATMMVTRPGAPNEPIKITATEWPAFKARGYHHAEQKENLNLINKIKKSGVAKGSMGKDDGDAERKRAGDFQAGLDKIKADMKKRQAARKANTDESVSEAYGVSTGMTRIKVHPKAFPITFESNEEDANEALDMKQRLARGRSARKNKSKLAMGRKKAGRRIASMKVLKKRAQRNARKQITKRLTKGVAKTDLSPARKREIEKRLDKPAFKVKINRLVKRTIKDIRKAEIARKRK